jgi:hypothetical protein
MAYWSRSEARLRTGSLEIEACVRASGGFAQAICILIMRAPLFKRGSSRIEKLFVQNPSDNYCTLPELHQPQNPF